MTSAGTPSFRLLGPLEAEADGRPVPLGGPKQRALLAILLLSPNEVLPRDRLIDELWHDHAPESAANALAALVARLRRALPADTVVTRPGGYAVHAEPEAIDVFRFERLAREGQQALARGDPARAAELLQTALSLWHGPPLGDLQYEPFAASVVLRLEELRLTAVESRIDAELALGHHTDVVGELRSLVLEHALRERPRAQLMLALYASGRQAEALEVYRETRELLLDELGIDPDGTLQELHQAILRQDAGLVAAAPVPAVADAPVAPSAVRLEGMRPVTSLAAAVVDPTVVDGKLTPAEAEALLGECTGLIRRAVEAFGGTVHERGRSGMRASFGAAAANRDDPDRAALTALRVLEGAASFAQDVDAAWAVSGLAVSVGVELGWTDGGDAPAEADAARLCEAAPPGQALLGPAVARRISRRFALEPLEAAWRLVAAPAPEAEAVEGGIGREAELAALVDIAAEVAAGRGRIVTITGVAGIGKSRLVAELRTRLGGDLTWLEGHCLSYGGLTPQPFAEILFGWLAAETGTPEIALRTKARARLGALLGDELDDVLASLDGLLGLRREPPADAMPAAYVRWLEALAAEGPVVLVLEDTHWADPATQELAEAVFGLTDRAAVGVVLTEEPDGTEGPSLRLRASERYPHRTTEVALAPLAADAAAALVARLAGDDVDAAERDALVREAEGNPLYLEELARALVEGSLEARGRTWTISLRSPELLPPTLENLLVARIDRLAAGPRALAQTAAALGRTFPVPVLTHLAGESAADDLAALFRTEIVREVRRYPDFECAFTHGLLQQAALATLTPVARRDLYARVAAAFEEVYRASLDDHHERLAHYHAQSGNLPRALEYAERARGRA